MMESVGKKKFKCDICRRSYRDKYNLSVHKRTHGSELPFRCAECDRSFNYKHVLRDHIVIKHCRGPLKYYNCPNCPYKSKRKQDLDRHNCTSSPAKKFPCSSCELVFTHPSNLRRHTRTVHARGDEFVCYLCERFFSTGSKLKLHIERLHNQSVICCVCNKSFASVGKLKVHQCRNHFAAIGLCCPFCEYVNATQNDERLTRHIREKHNPKK